MDAIDRKILDLLQNDGRITMKELGQKIGLTSPATIERVKKLEESGIIKGYKAILNNRQTGLPVRAFILLSCANTQTCQNFADFAQNYDAILACHRITGEFSFIIDAVVPDMKMLETLIDELMLFGNTQTHMVLSSLVEHKPILLPE